MKRRRAIECRIGFLPYGRWISTLVLRASIDYVEQLLHILSRLTGQSKGTQPRKDIRSERH
jgi:hypothetical protein